jgi:CHRD domain
MNALRQVARRSLWAGIGVAAILAAGCAGMSSGGKAPVKLSGGQEVPPVGGNASGTTDITIILTACTGGASARCPQAVGTMTTSGVVATAAHIHRGKVGQNGPVILPLIKTGENTWAVPDRGFLSDSDLSAYQNGELYVNVHSANNPNGEVRGQLVP